VTLTALVRAFQKTVANRPLKRIQRGQDSDKHSDTEEDDTEEETYSTGEPKNPLGSDLWQMLTNSWTEKNYVTQSLSHDYDKVKILDYMGNTEWIEVKREDTGDKVRLNRQKAEVTR
jgi:hypothetical protein